MVSRACLPPARASEIPSTVPAARTARTQIPNAIPGGRVSFSLPSVSGCLLGTQVPSYYLVHEPNKVETRYPLGTYPKFQPLFSLIISFPQISKRNGVWGERDHFIFLFLFLFFVWEGGGELIFFGLAWVQVIKQLENGDFQKFIPCVKGMDFFIKKLML